MGTYLAKIDGLVRVRADVVSDVESEEDAKADVLADMDNLLDIVNNSTNNAFFFFTVDEDSAGDWSVAVEEDTPSQKTGGERPKRDIGSLAAEYNKLRRH